MFRPRRVVVPKPEPDISRAEMEVVAVPAIVVVEKYRFPPAFRNVHCAIPVPAERASWEVVVEAMVRLANEDEVVVPMSTLPF